MRVHAPTHERSPRRSSTRRRSSASSALASPSQEGREDVGLSRRDLRAGGELRRGSEAGRLAPSPFRGDVEGADEGCSDSSGGASRVSPSRVSRGVRRFECASSEPRVSRECVASASLSSPVGVSMPGCSPCSSPLSCPISSPISSPSCSSSLGVARRIGRLAALEGSPPGCSTSGKPSAAAGGGEPSGEPSGEPPKASVLGWSVARARPPPPRPPRPRTAASPAASPAAPPCDLPASPPSGPAAATAPPPPPSPEPDCRVPSWLEPPPGAESPESPEPPRGSPSGAVVHRRGDGRGGDVCATVGGAVRWLSPKAAAVGELAEELPSSGDGGGRGRRRGEEAPASASMAAAAVPAAAVPAAAVPAARRCGSSAAPAGPWRSASISPRSRRSSSISAASASAAAASSSCIAW